MKLNFRQATPDDLNEMKDLFAGTIQSVCAKDYDQEQRDVWSASIHNTQRWLDLVNDQLIVLALSGDRIAGYGSLKDGTYIDFFYVHKDFQRQGIADQLFERLETEARKAGASELSADVSISARGFFTKKGFDTIVEQKNVRDGVELVNYKMMKIIRLPVASCELPGWMHRLGG